jgi:hypothetical protein
MLSKDLPALMPTLLISLVMFVPQLVAELRKSGPAAHLTLLLLSICAVTSVLSALAISSQSPPQLAGPETDYITPIGYAAVGLSILTPFYWAIEHICDGADFQIDIILVHSLALTFAAILCSSVLQSAFLLVEVFALCLIATLFLRAGWMLLQRRTQT